jgi:hypothetical protein
VETQVMAASTHCLRLGRALQRPLLLLDELGLGFENGETTTVVVLQGPATHSGDDEDEPPVTPDEILNAVHGSPFRSVPRDSGRRLHQPEVAPDPCIDGHSSHSKLLYGDMGQPDRARAAKARCGSIQPSVDIVSAGGRCVAIVATPLDRLGWGRGRRSARPGRSSTSSFGAAMPPSWPEAANDQRGRSPFRPEASCGQPRAEAARPGSGRSRSTVRWSPPARPGRQTGRRNRGRIAAGSR